MRIPMTGLKCQSEGAIEQTQCSSEHASQVKVQLSGNVKSLPQAETGLKGVPPNDDICPMRSNALLNS